MTTGLIGSSTRRPSEREYRDEPLDSLLPHPLNQKLYGLEKPDPDLIASIRTDGILEPILVTRLSFNKGKSYEDYIVAGHRRWAAAKSIAETDGIKRPRVPVRWLSTTNRGKSEPELLEIERSLIESNRQRVKTKGQLAREVFELLRIEKALAKERMIETQNNEAARIAAETKALAEVGAHKKKIQQVLDNLDKLRDAAANGDGKAKVEIVKLRKVLFAGKEKLPKQRKGQARDLVGKAIGASGKTVEKMAAVVEKANDGDAVAKEQLVLLDRNETSFEKAYTAVTPSPSKNPTLQVQENTARELTKELNAKGWDCTVARSKIEDKFHLTIRDLTAEQIRAVEIGK